ncbi:MAG TPA: hypothetical protein VGM18_05235 [Candidatus Sulfotelmatobacter sp.]
MKVAWLSFVGAVLTIPVALLLSCGSGKKTLTIEPTSETITVNLQTGTMTGQTQLVALLNNNPLPAGSVLWYSNNAAVLTVDQEGNPTCEVTYGIAGNQANAAIAASWRELTAAVGITCQYQ